MPNKLLRNFDYVMLFCLLALIGYGLLMIYSATLSTETGGITQTNTFRQGVFALIGFVVFFVLISFDYEVLLGLSTPFYVACLGLMAAVLVIGQATHGSQRWIDLGFTTIEPSELARLAVVITLAKYLSDHEEDMYRLRYVLKSALIVAPFIVLAILQPHLGTIVVLLVIWFSMVLMAGVRLRHLAFFGAAGVVVAPFAWFVLPPYMHERVADFLNPQADPLGSGYNVIQALISVGSGGFFGRGFTSGTQSQLHFLRVQYADFIFSVLAEELGFIGAVLLFVLFIVLLMRGIRTAALARDSFGRFMAAAIVAMIGFQVFVNVGINTGMLPVTGLPLPFISYGGSSLLSFMVAVALLENIVMHHQKAEF